MCIIRIKAENLPLDCCPGVAPLGLGVWIIHIYLENGPLLENEPLMDCEFSIILTYEKISQFFSCNPENDDV